MNQSGRIYLDHAATTPCRDESLAEMQRVSREYWHNPSTLYLGGREARKELDRLRDRAAALLGVSSREIVFNSGGSEGDNQALLGAALAFGKPGHFIISDIEHSAIHRAAERLLELGCEMDLLEAGEDGVVNPADLDPLIRDDTFIVSVMTVNNEIGTIQPVEKLGRICRDRGVPFHTDAVQGFGYFPIKAHVMNLDMLSLSAHKLYGPRGVGVFFVRQGLELSPLIVGGGQELGQRAGTENLAAVAGMVCAMELIRDERDTSNEMLRAERDEFVERVFSTVPDVRLNGDRERRVPNNASLSFLGIEGETLALRLDKEGIEASAGSACSAGSAVTSRVIKALGVPEEFGRGTVRFTFGKLNCRGDGERAAEIVARVVRELREAREDADFV